MVNRNKKGWIKIAEAFLAILLLMGILLVIIRSDEVKIERSKVINEAQNNFLNNVEINESLRETILTLENLPINSGETEFPDNLKNYFLDNFENCFINICLTSDECTLDFESEGEIYSTEILISANIHLYSPRKVKVICYE